MKRILCYGLPAILAVQSFAAVRGESAAYVAGTLKLPEGAEGSLNLDDPKVLRFTHKGGTVDIPYAQITSMEFGQKVGRRVGATIALGVTTLGLMALPMLFSKKKKHYLTLGYTNAEGFKEAAIFELAKGIVRESILILETRTGKRVEIDTEEAKDTDVSHSVAHLTIAPPAPLADFKLTLESTPAAAEVIIDGKPAGQTPLSTTLSLGSHLILIRSEGHRQWTRDVLARAGENQTISAELVKQQAAAPISTGGTGYVITVR